MRIVRDAVVQPSDLLLLGFKEFRHKMLQEVEFILFKQNEGEHTLVLTDFNDEKHIFFIEHKEQHLRYFRPFTPHLDSILF